MAKLFMTIESERTSKHQIANKEIEIRIYYGSRENPKLLAHILVKPNGNSVEFFQKSTIQPKPFESA